MTSGWLGLLALLHGHLREEEGGCLRPKEPLIVLNEDLDDGGDLFGVALLQHVGGVRGPEEGGAHADGQVGAGHHVLLKEKRKMLTFLCRFTEEEMTTLSES